MRRRVMVVGHNKTATHNTREELTAGSSCFFLLDVDWTRVEDSPGSHPFFSHFDNKMIRILVSYLDGGLILVEKKLLTGYPPHTSNHRHGTLMEQLIGWHAVMALFPSPLEAVEGSFYFCPHPTTMKVFRPNTTGCSRTKHTVNFMSFYNESRKLIIKLCGSVNP